MVVTDSEPETERTRVFLMIYVEKKTMAPKRWRYLYYE